MNEVTVEAMMIPVPIWEGIETFMKNVIDVVANEFPSHVVDRLNEEIVLLKERTGWGEWDD